MSWNKSICPPDRQRSPLQGDSTTFHFGEYQQVMVDASNVKVNSRFLQKPPVMKSKSGLFFPPKIKPVILFPFTAKAKNLTFSSLQDEVLKGRQAFKTDVVQLIRVWRRWAVVCRGRHKSSKLLLTSWYVVFGDGQLVTSQWRQLNIAENCLPWKQSFAGGERKQQGCGSWARGPPATAPVHPGSSVQTDTTGTWQQLFLNILQQEAVNTVAAPVYYPSPNVSRPASQLTEEEQVLRKTKLPCNLFRGGGTYLPVVYKLNWDPWEAPLCQGCQALTALT